MKKYFISADIHGHYQIYKEQLLLNGFEENNKNHILIICGDAFDRGGEEFKLLNFLNKMRKSKRLIYIKGNHDTLLQELLTGERDYKRHDWHNGTFKTVYMLSGLDKDIYENNKYEIQAQMFDLIPHKIKKFNELLTPVKKKFSPLFNSMVDYFETKNYIFVHGWIPCEFTPTLHKAKYNPNWREADQYEWDDSRWTNGIKASIDDCIEPGKTIVCGHWYSSYGNVRKFKPEIEKSHKISKKDKEELYKKYEFSNAEYFKPYIEKGIIALDACTALSKQINILVLNEDEL